MNTLVDKILPAFFNKLDYVGQERSKVQALLDTFGIKTKTYGTEELRSRGEEENTSKLRSIGQESKEEEGTSLGDRLIRLYHKKLQESR